MDEFLILREKSQTQQNVYYINTWSLREGKTKPGIQGFIYIQVVKL